MVVALQICSCMLSDPSHLLTPDPHPPKEAGWTTVSCRCTGFSLLPLCRLIQHPSPHTSSSPVCPVFLLHSSVCSHVHGGHFSLLFPPYLPLLTSALSLCLEYLLLCWPLKRRRTHKVWSCYRALRPPPPRISPTKTSWVHSNAAFPQ